MKAIVQRAFGRPGDVLELQEVDRPSIGPDEVLVRVHAAGVNVGDLLVMRGRPVIVRFMGSGLFRPKYAIPGQDVAGQVVAVGERVADLRPGDAVFGELRGGAYAEYARAPANLVVPKPAGLTFEQAAALPIAALAALKALRDVAHVREGHKVLIIGASGGVGTFAVQLAKSMGAEVTGVCSTRNVELVRSLGADHVVDYTKEDVTRGDQRYDVILDNVASHSLGALRRILTRRGTLMPNGAAGGVRRLVHALALSPFVGQKLRPFVSTPNQQDLLALKDLVEAGTITPVIDRTYPLIATAEALRYVAKGHARGKVVITVPVETS